MCQGDYASGDSHTLGIPLQMPLLVIRDPPGSDSTVTYSKVETAVKGSVENYEKYTGMNAEGGLGFGLEGKIETCLGFLVGYSCASTVDAEGSVGAHIEHASQQLVDLKDDENAHGMTVLWSYSTSTEPEV